MCNPRDDVEEDDDIKSLSLSISTFDKIDGHDIVRDSNR